MKLLVLVTTVFIFLKPSEQMDNNQDNNDGDIINNGASTSRHDTQSCICELDIYASELTRLLLAQDTSGLTLTELMASRPHELVAFYEEVQTYMLLAQYGNTRSSLLADEGHRASRNAFFLLRLREAIADTVGNAFMYHHNQSLTSEYDNVLRAYVVRENLQEQSSECLCYREYIENVILSSSFSLPSLERPSRATQMNFNGQELTVYETTLYHIIPLATLRRFFESWLTDEADDEFARNEYITGCARVLFGRLRRSLQKIILALLVTSDGYSSENLNALTSIQNDADQTFFSQIFSSTHIWLPGNIFLGPGNRVRHEPENVFDTDANFVINNEDRYVELETLYHMLLIFSHQARSLPPLWRLVNGFEIFFEIHDILIQHRMTRMDSRHWEAYTSEVEGMGQERYWKVKRLDTDDEHQDRRRRSANEFKESDDLYSKNPDNNWSHFVTYLYMNAIKGESLEKSPGWICDFRRLYHNYLFKEKKARDGKCPKCASFKRYLYMKISNSRSWKDCIAGTKVDSSWCQAWRKISQILNKDSKYLGNKTFRISISDGSKSAALEKYVETFLDWVASKTGLKSCDTESIKKPEDHHWYDSVLCTVTLLMIRGCSKQHLIVHDEL